LAIKKTAADFIFNEPFNGTQGTGQTDAGRKPHAQNQRGGNRG
jgi:hypothetical protein